MSQLHVYNCLCLPDILGQLTFLLVLEIRFPAMFWKFSVFKVLAYFNFMPLFHRFKTLSWHIRTDNLYERSVLGCFGRNLKLRKCLHFEESLYAPNTSGAKILIFQKYTTFNNLETFSARSPPREPQHIFKKAGNSPNLPVFP